MIEHLKKNMYNPNPVEIKIHHQIFPGVVFHYYEKKFPILISVLKKKLIFDPKERIIHFKD